MTNAAELIREFLTWVETDGRELMLKAIAARHSHPPQVARTLLDDHLSTIATLGLVLASERISALVSYARTCEGAPVPPEAALDRLHSWPALRRELPT